MATFFCCCLLWFTYKAIHISVAKRCDKVVEADKFTGAENKEVTDKGKEGKALAIIYAKVQ